jgi:AraC-like DNA-binding protein
MDSKVTSADAVVGAFGAREAPRLMARTAGHSTVAVTEIRGYVNGFTQPFPYDDAYLLHLRLSTAPPCNYFLDGRHVTIVEGAPERLQIHDLRRSPVAEIRGSLHNLYFYLPRASLNEVADEAGTGRVDDLQLAPGVNVQDDVVRNLLFSLRPALSAPREASPLFVEHTATALVAHVLHTYGTARKPNPERHGELAPWQVRRARELLSASVVGNVSLTHLARECGLSIRHFSRAFRNTLGLPPHRYLLKSRVEHACRLLLDPRLRLTEVALACGFSDQSHMTRVFRTLVKMSPGAWRRLHGRLDC